MLGGVSAISTILGAAPAADSDAAVLKSFARAACDAGLHLLLIEPYGKRPVDVRSSVQRRNDDAAAQAVARAAGRPDWDRVKSRGGVYLATDDPKLIARYIDRYRQKYAEEHGPNVPVNFAVAVGPSGLVVVDCDTRSQLEAFLSDAAQHAGIAPNLMIPPTVRTPGQQDSEGNWAHSDGGHFYFPVDQPQPEVTGSLTMPGGYVILWADRYVLIPPSVRAEGTYTLSGQDFPAPEWLTKTIADACQVRVARMLESRTDSTLTTAVDQWAAAVGWADILSPHGWSMTARPDNCGCDIWTAPGDHASPKSATAHDVECSLGRYTPENAPLHIWTDNPGPELEAWVAAHGGSKTLSRLQVVAALEFDGNVGTAMHELGVVPDESGALAFGKDLGAELGVQKSNLDAPLDIEAAQNSESSAQEDDSESADADPFVIAGTSTPHSQDSGNSDASDSEPEDAPLPSGVPTIMPFAYWRELPPPQFVVDGLLEHRGFGALIGPPGVGKSGAVLDMAGAICTGRPWMGRRTMRQRVLYLPGEGLSGAVQRLRAWESAHDVELTDLYVGNSIVQVAASQEAWAAVIMRVLECEIGMIIIDTFARAAVGLEENSATDVGKAIARFDQVRKATNTGLLVVHHTGKAGSSGRGSSALNGALDTELLLTEGQWWDRDADGPPPGRPLELWVTKQKNAPQPEHAIPMLAVPHDDSFIMTGPSGVVDDPLDSMVSVRAVTPEPIVSVAIRLQEYAQRFQTQGLTRAEFAYGVPPDEHTNIRRDAKTAWRMKVSEAVDLGLRYGLIQTLTGTPTGARYIPDVTTADQARARWAAENMPD